MIGNPRARCLTNTSEVIDWTMHRRKPTGVAVGRVVPLDERVKKYQRMISARPERICKLRIVFRNVFVDDSR